MSLFGRVFGGSNSPQQTPSPVAEMNAERDAATTRLNEENAMLRAEIEELRRSLALQPKEHCDDKLKMQDDKYQAIRAAENEAEAKHLRRVRNSNRLIVPWYLLAIIIIRSVNSSLVCGAFSLLVTAVFTLVCLPILYYNIARAAFTMVFESARSKLKEIRTTVSTKFSDAKRSFLNRNQDSKRLRCDSSRIMQPTLADDSMNWTSGTHDEFIMDSYTSDAHGVPDHDRMRFPRDDYHKLHEFSRAPNSLRRVSVNDEHVFKGPMPSVPADEFSSTSNLRNKDSKSNVTKQSVEESCCEENELLHSAALDSPAVTMPLNQEVLGLDSSSAIAVDRDKYTKEELFMDSPENNDKNVQNISSASIRTSGSSALPPQPKYHFEEPLSIRLAKLEGEKKGLESSLDALAVRRELDAIELERSLKSTYEDHVASLQQDSSILTEKLKREATEAARLRDLNLEKVKNEQLQDLIMLEQSLQLSTHQFQADVQRGRDEQEITLARWATKDSQQAAEQHRISQERQEREERERQQFEESIREERQATARAMAEEARLYAEERRRIREEMKQWKVTIQFQMALVLQLKAQRAWNADVEMKWAERLGRVRTVHLRVVTAWSEVRSQMFARESSVTPTDLTHAVTALSDCVLDLLDFVESERDDMAEMKESHLEAAFLDDLQEVFAEVAACARAFSSEVTISISEVGMTRSVGEAYERLASAVDAFPTIQQLKQKYRRQSERPSEEQSNGYRVEEPE